MTVIGTLSSFHKRRAMSPHKRGSGRSAGQPTLITRTRNGHSETRCPTFKVMIQKAVQ